MSATPVIPSPMPPFSRENPAGLTADGREVRLKDGVLQFKANDDLWYDFKLVRDQGSTVPDVDQVGEE